MSFGQPQSSGFGAFGSTNTASSSGAFGGGAPAAGGFSGGFGASAKPAAGGFGSTGGSGAGAFGASTAAAPASFGGFGASSTTPAVGGFGAATSAAPTSSGFGTSTAPSTGAFGSSGGFGSTSGAAPAPGAFGASSTGTFGTGGFGTTTSASSGLGATTSTSNAFGTTAPTTTSGGQNMNTFGNTAFGSGGVGQQLMPQGREGFEGELSRISDIKKQYAPIQTSSDGSPHGLIDVNASVNSNVTTQGPFPWNEDCAFKFTIYPPKDQAGRYLQFKDEYLDTVAIERNPDPDRLVPRTLMGATELRNRYKSQNSESARMVTELEKIKSTQIGPIRHEQSQLSVKYRQFKDKHNEQARRLTKLLRDVEVLRNRGRPLHNEEIRHREEYDRAIIIKSGFEGKLTQLESLTSAYSAEIGENAENEHFEQMTDADLLTIYQLLSKQHEGILHLTRILDKDLRDAEIMARGISAGKR